MPIVKFIKNEKQNPSAMKGSIDYCLQKCKTVDVQTGKRYVSGINCNGLNAYKEFMTTKLANNANNGRYFYQYVQSFSPKDNVDYDKAHKIALEFAEKAWQGYEILVTTCDRNHIHTHFIINSVSFETGKKLRQNPNTLKTLRKLNDEICTKYNVIPLKPYTKTKEKRLSDGEYRMAMKGDSWKFALMFTIDNAMKKCKTKKEFIDEMKKNGYEVLWTDERKHITYTCPNGMKCRDIKLHQEKYRKEKMELEFELRRIETEKCTAESYVQRYDSKDGTSYTGDNCGERLLESTDKSEQKSESQLSTIEQNQVDEKMINHYSAQIILQLKKRMTEQENTIQKELKNQETILTEQAGNLNESMLSVTEPTKDLLKEMKKKWIPIFFGTIIGIQVFFQILSILLEICLK